MTAASTVTGQPPGRTPGVTRGPKEALRDEAVARTAMHDGDGTVEAFAGVDAIPEAATEREMPRPSPSGVARRAPPHEREARSGAP